MAMQPDFQSQSSLIGRLVVGCTAEQPSNDDAFMMSLRQLYERPFFYCDTLTRLNKRAKPLSDIAERAKLVPRNQCPSLKHLNAATKSRPVPLVGLVRIHLLIEAIKASENPEFVTVISVGGGPLSLPDDCVVPYVYRVNSGLLRRIRERAGYNRQNLSQSIFGKNHSNFFFSLEEGEKGREYRVPLHIAQSVYDRLADDEKCNNGIDFPGFDELFSHDPHTGPRQGLSTIALPRRQAFLPV